MATRILIVDDSSAIREAVRSCLERTPQLEICGEAENGRSAIDVARRTRPDVVVLDVSMPVMNGLDAARELAALRPRPAIVLFTGHECDELSTDVEDLGIRTVISKSDHHALEQLRQSVQEAA